MSNLANSVASRLQIIMGHHTIRAKLGETLMEALVKLPAPINRNRRPDLCFYSYNRWPKNKPVAGRQNGRDAVPDLAVEVISPSDFAEDNHEKLVEYFQAGVLQVWVIYPQLGLLYIYDSVVSARGYTKTDVIDGGTILPGFQFTLSELFPDEMPG